MSDSACEYIIYTPGQKQNVMLLHTVITPSPGPRQLILFVLPMKFCTQMNKTEIPSSLLNCCFSAAQFPFFVVFFFVLFSGICLHRGGSLSLHTSLMAHKHTYTHAQLRREQLH